MAYSPKNAVGPTGMGGNNPLSGEQVLQGVMDPTATSLQTTPMIGGSPASAANPLPVTGTIAITDPTATFAEANTQTITLGGTSQVVFAALATRVYLFVINTSDTVMYLRMGSAATNTAIPLVAGGGFYEPLIAPGASVNILCATTGKAFVAIQG